MKLTGPACTEATSEAEEAKRRERAEDSAGGVRVELINPLLNQPGMVESGVSNKRVETTAAPRFCLMLGGNSRVLRALHRHRKLVAHPYRKPPT